MSRTRQQLSICNERNNYMLGKGIEIFLFGCLLNYLNLICPWKPSGGVHKKVSLVFRSSVVWVTAFFTKEKHNYTDNFLERLAIGDVLTEKPFWQFIVFPLLPLTSKVPKASLESPARASIK